jgi:hypothetical protein
MLFPYYISNWNKMQGLSQFGTATLDLREKAGFRPRFPRACGKTIGFWNRLCIAFYSCAGPKAVVSKPTEFETASEGRYPPLDSGVRNVRV